MNTTKVQTSKVSGELYWENFAFRLTQGGVKRIYLIV